MKHWKRGSSLHQETEETIFFVLPFSKFKVRILLFLGERSSWCIRPFNHPSIRFSMKGEFMAFFSKAWYSQQHSFFREMKSHLVRWKVIAGFCFFVTSATTDKIISPELNENMKHQPGDEILVVFTLTIPQSSTNHYRHLQGWWFMALFLILKAMEIDMEVPKK